MKHKPNYSKLWRSVICWCFIHEQKNFRISECSTVTLANCNNTYTSLQPLNNSNSNKQFNRDAWYVVTNLQDYALCFFRKTVINKWTFELTSLSLHIHARGTSLLQVASCEKRTLHCTRGFPLPRTDEPEIKQFCIVVK